MKNRLPVLVLALVFLVPVLGRAETRTAYAPYVEEVDGSGDCSSFPSSGSCVATDDADYMTGRMAGRVDMASGGNGSGLDVEYASAFPQVWGNLPMNAGSTIVVTATFRVRDASAYRTGTLASASGNALAQAFANAYLKVVHDDGCDLADGCVDEGACAGCGSASSQVTIVDVAEQRTAMHEQDVIVSVALRNPAGRFPAGTLHFYAGVSLEASLARNLPGEGAAGVDVDAVLTRVVAVIS